MQTAIQCRAVLSRDIRVAIWALVISILFLTQIAYMIGDFPVAIPLILYFATVGYLVSKNLLTVQYTAAIMLLLFVIVGISGFRNGSGRVSTNSFLMMVVLYFPFVLDCKNDWQINSIRKYFFAVFIYCSVVLAVIAIVQFVLVNYARMTILSNVYNILPNGFHEIGGYSYTHYEHGITKANGYFLRESALLSLNMALAIAMEYFDRRRVAVLALLALALFLSFSGTGIVMLAVAVFVPTSRRSLRRVVLVLLGGILMWEISDQIPAVHLWTERLQEFQARGSSGYARFVAPILLLSTGQGDLSVILFGNGAGSFDRTVRPLSVLLNFEISGAGLFKSLYEYGLLGCILLNGLVARRLYLSNMRLELKNILFCTWLLFIVNWGEDFLLFWLLSSWQTRFETALELKPRAVASGECFPRVAGHSVTTGPS